MSTSTEKTEALIPLLDAFDATPGAVELRARSYELLRVAPGALVADVGCGAGRAVAELADQGVRAVGIDLSEQMIAAARARRPDGDLRVGDAYALPFQEGEVAGYRAEKVFHGLPDPGRALTEARRILAPSGRIVLCGQDWDTLVIDSADPELTRTIVRTRADQMESPRAARQYRNLLLDAGFRDVAVEVRVEVFTADWVIPLFIGFAEACRAAGTITRVQADAWIAEQQERARTDRLFLAIPLFMASATNP